MSLEGKRTNSGASVVFRARTSPLRKLSRPMSLSRPGLLRWSCVLGASMLCLCSAPALAQWRLLGCDYNGILYDVDIATGAATNPRPTGIPTLAGIAYSPQGILYGLSTFQGSFDYPGLVNSLFQIDPDTGASTHVGRTGFDVAEGDIVFDPASGTLWGFNAVGYGLVNSGFLRIDPQSGAGTLSIWNSGNVDISGMSLLPDGRLFLLQTDRTTLQASLLRVDPATGAILDTDALGLTLGGTGGLVYDSTTQFFYLADGGQNSGKTFYSYHLSTATLTELGPTGAPNGLSGLAFIPEPGTGLVLVFAMLGAYRWRPR